MTEERGGIGCAGVLLIVFVTLKLTGLVAWSWWWVLAPAWVPLSLWLAIVGLVALCFAQDRQAD